MTMNTAESKTPSMIIERPGTMDYPAALEYMRRIHGEVVKQSRPDTVIMLNHPPVFTTGRRIDEGQALGPVDRDSKGDCHINGTPLVSTERGGLFTYHDEGQIILYPILRVSKRRGLFRRLVCLLEETVIEFCAGFGIEAKRREGDGIQFMDDMCCIQNKYGAVWGEAPRLQRLHRCTCLIYCAKHSGRGPTHETGHEQNHCERMRETGHGICSDYSQ